MTLIDPKPAPPALELDELFDRATVDRLLTTTRAVRQRLDIDRPVEPEVIQECLDLAVQAPTANNREAWRWLVVTDPGKRAEIADLYRTAWKVHSSALKAASRGSKRGADYQRHFRNRASADWLADNLERVPVLVIACLVGRPPGESAPPPPPATAADDDAGRVTYAKRQEAALAFDSLYYGSIFPAIWSFQLALRSRGLGTTITVAHLPFEGEIARILKIPRLVTQIALLPVAYTRGLSFSPSKRAGAESMTYWDTWDVRRPRGGGNDA